MFRATIALALALTACGPEAVEEMSTDAYEKGGRWCASSDECPANKTCSTEFGDCFTRPGGGNRALITPVSYTHLTLPTNREV